MALIQTDIENYVKMFMAESIMKGIDQQKWDAHLAKCKTLKVDEYVNYYQEIYNEFLGKK